MPSTMMCDLDIDKGRFFSQNRFPMDALNIPRLATVSSYAERDPNLKNNWRGKGRQDITNIPVTKVRK